MKLLHPLEYAERLPKIIVGEGCPTYIKHYPANGEWMPILREEAHMPKKKGQDEEMEFTP